MFLAAFDAAAHTRADDDESDSQRDDEANDQQRQHQLVLSPFGEEHLGACQS